MDNRSPLPSELYRKAILREATRTLGLMDREPLSPTAGCCDRVYWAWKFVDFPGARFQEALCVLAFLYRTPFPENIYCSNHKLLGWISQGLRYWCSIQYHDGSFDEAYPFERSLAATAFTVFYVGEALRFLGDSLTADDREAVVEAMRKAGKWLCRNDETHGFLSNHLAAAAAALHHVYLLTDDGQFLERGRFFLERILDRQSAEGWYEEYGGADPGYQTHGSFYLVRYWQLAHEERVADSLMKAMDFLAHFIHPDGSLGGEYTSRNTQTYYPAAFEMFAPQSDSAAWIASFMRRTFLSGSAADLGGVDSYNYFPFLNNVVFAYLACIEDESSQLAEPDEPYCQEQTTWYPEAGMARIRRNSYEAYVGTSKGGVLKLFDRSRRELVYSDCGYLGKLRNGRTFSSQYFDGTRMVIVDEDRITVRGAFFESEKPTMKPLRFIAFRSFMISFGRFAAIAQWLKRYLVKVLIYRKRALDIDFERTITFEDDCVIVSDVICGPDSRQVECLRWAESFTTIHMGSSRYFIKNEIIESGVASAEVITPNQIRDGVVLTRKIPFGTTV